MGAAAVAGVGLPELREPCSERPVVATWRDWREGGREGCRLLPVWRAPELAHPSCSGGPPWVRGAGSLGGLGRKGVGGLQGRQSSSPQCPAGALLGILNP